MYFKYRVSLSFVPKECECNLTTDTPETPERHCPYRGVGDGFVGEIPGGVSVGRTITFTGTANIHARRFYVGLVAGEADHPRDIQFILDNRISWGIKNGTVLVNKIAGVWQKEVYHKSLIILPGEDFSIEIEINDDGFSVTRNEKFLEHLPWPFTGATHVRVWEDVHISHICFS